MAETKVEIRGIENLQVKSKVKEVQIEGSSTGDKETVLITTVTFDYEGPGGKFDPIMWALTSKHEVDVVVSSPQMSMEVTFTEAREPVRA